jgi:hypothetical protein
MKVGVGLSRADVQVVVFSSGALSTSFADT